MTHKNYCDQHTITSPFLIFHFFIVNIHQNWTPSLPRQKYLSPINSVIIHFQFSARFLNFQQFKNILFLPCFQFGRRDVFRDLKIDQFTNCRLCLTLTVVPSCPSCCMCDFLSHSAAKKARWKITQELLSLGPQHLLCSHSLPKNSNYFIN